MLFRSGFAQAVYETSPLLPVEQKERWRIYIGNIAMQPCYPEKFQAEVLARLINAELHRLMEEAGLFQQRL